MRDWLKPCVLCAPAGRLVQLRRAPRIRRQGTNLRRPANATRPDPVRLPAHVAGRTRFRVEKSGRLPGKTAGSIRHLVEWFSAKINIERSQCDRQEISRRFTQMNADQSKESRHWAWLFQICEDPR